MSVFIITNAKRTGGIERSQPLIDGYNIEWTDGWTDGRMDGSKQLLHLHRSSQQEAGYKMKGMIVGDISTAFIILFASLSPIVDLYFCVSLFVSLFLSLYLSLQLCLTIYLSICLSV